MRTAHVRLPTRPRPRKRQAQPLRAEQRESYLKNLIHSTVRQSCVGCDVSLSFEEFNSMGQMKNGSPIPCGRAMEPNRSADRYMAAHSRWAATVGSLSSQVIP